MEIEDTVRKRARGSGVVGGVSTDGGGPDRLSSLPDCLLHTIMSFLKARQVVQTCVLSTRWMHLWRSVPSLDIDFDEFENKALPSNGDRFHRPYIHIDDDGSSGSDSGRWSGYPGGNDLKEGRHFAKYTDWEKFEDFTVTLLRRCDIAQLDSFRLDIDGTRMPELAYRVAAGWLRRAMKYYTPDRASKLGLSSGSWLLKKLHLRHLLLDKDFPERVSSVCPSLEELELDGCTCKFQSITSHSLKTLVLKNCQWRHLSEITSPTLKTLVIDGVSNVDERVLVIFSPTLAYLHLAVHVLAFPGGVSLNEVPYIVSVSIHLKDHRYIYPGYELDSDQFKLLHSISNSTNLELSGVRTTVLGKEPRFQEFKNLRNLLLDDCDLSDDFKILVFFLRSSPILEKLTLRCCKFPKHSSKKKRTPICNQFSSCDLSGLDLLCENLKVEIIYNDGDGARLMRLLLRILVNLSKNNIKLTKVN